MSDNLVESGFLGPTTFGGESTDVPGSPTETVTNSEATPLALGEIIRLSGNLAVLRSKADVVGNLQGTVGVTGAVIPAATPGVIITSGKATVLMAAGLVGVGAGQTVYVDATTGGRGTNTAPANALAVAVIKDASNYGVDGTVVADVNIAAGVAAGGAFPGFGGAGATVSAAAGAAGVSPTAARSDQTHQVLTSGAAPTSVDIGDAGTAGASNALARSDHQHPFPASVTAPPDVGPTGAVGVATTAARSDHTHGGGPANWTLGAMRWYAVDFTGGNDANAGFSDVSMTAAGAVAKKTIAGLVAILPYLGANRDVTVAIKRRDASGTSYGETIDEGNYPGYQQFHVVGTTDFTDSASDRITSGAVIGSAGPNGDSSWTVAAGATVNSVPIAAGALPAEPGIAVMRIRFDPATATVALRNVCGIVQQNSAGTITTSPALPAVPAAGDTFFVERPGVVVTTVIGNLYGSSAGVQQSAVRNRGIGTTSFWNLSGPSCALHVTFCEAQATGFFANKFNAIFLSPSYRPISGGQSLLGMSLRAVGGIKLQDIEQLTGTAWGQPSGATTFSQVGFDTAMGASSVVLGTVGAASITCDDCYVFGATGSLGSSTALASTTRPLRMSAGQLRLNSNNNLLCFGIDLQNIGAGVAVQIGGSVPGGQRVRFLNMTGSTGNTGVGYLSLGIGNSMQWDASSSPAGAGGLTGTGGDIEVNSAGLPIIAVDFLNNFNGIIDDLGNTFIGVAGNPVGPCRLVVNGSGGTLTAGQIVKTTAINSTVIATKADSTANATGVMGVLQTTCLNTRGGLVGIGGTLSPICDAAPTPLNLLYLSEANAGQGRDTPPAANGAGNNQKLRLGYVNQAFVVAAVNYAKVPWNTELVPVDSSPAP